MKYSWRSGCPVALDDLRILRVDHWSFSMQRTRGELVVHRDVAAGVLRAVERMWQARFPIRRMRLVDEYGGDDDRSMAADNTSAFNCRYVKGTTRWSEHSYGRAIDINPIENPYVYRSGEADPPAGQPYANRSRRAPGMIHDGDAVVDAWAASGWRWGGYWSGAKDYQHFSRSGR